jgi:hypothetical protein
VSLGWLETTHMYIGSRSMTVSRGRQLVGLASDGGSLRDRLAAAVNPGAAMLRPRTRLRIWLGAASCQALSFDVPKGVRSWAELQAIAAARAQAGAQVFLDGSRVGFGAQVAPSCLADIRQWAGENKLSLASIRPLWSVAASERSLHRGKHAVAVLEPDFCTVLVDRGDGSSTGESWPVEGAPQARQLLGRWSVAENLGPASVSLIRFVEAGALVARDTIEPRTRLFAGCWSIE